MYRLLLILGLLVILYFLVRKALREFNKPSLPNQGNTGHDQMIQDPVCRIYIPRSERRERQHRRPELLLLQHGLRANFPQATFQLAPRILVRTQFLLLIEFQCDLALIRREVKKRRATFAAGDPKIGPLFSTKKSRRFSTWGSPFVFEPCRYLCPPFQPA